jgi:prephenate dehydrogenase
MNKPKLALIGIGLIGGSLARALKRAGATAEIVGYSNDTGECKTAVELGVVDRCVGSAADAARGADVVVIATPVGAATAILQEIAPVLGDDSIVTDTGSVKLSVIAAAREALGDRYSRFVAGHPIAGTEKSGVAASFADLYVNQRVILSPEANTAAHAVAVVRGLWKAAGARVEVMSAAEHDAILAYTSHLPHMVAYALVDCLARAEPTAELLRFAAGGFRDLTRIASSHPLMWRDIAIANRNELLSALHAYQQSIGEIVAAIEAGDGAHLHAVFTRARALREQLNAASISVDRAGQ